MQFMSGETAGQSITSIPLGPQEVLRKPSRVRSRVILLERQLLIPNLTSKKRNKDRGKNFVNVSTGRECSIHDNQIRTETGTNGSPHHDAATANSVTFKNTAVCKAFMPSAINTESSISKAECKPRFIGKDNPVPVLTSNA